MTERTYLSMLKDEPEVLTVIEAAKILRIGKNKAYDLINLGKLSSIKMGGKIIVPKMCVIQFLMNVDNYQKQSQIITNSLWTLAESCGMMCNTDDKVKASV